tara:strand:- start:257 stop:742 length:486 start_codon:yes stop_codon:yes gene_type:complete
MKYLIILIFSILLSDVERLDPNVIKIHEYLIAPCCGNGILSEHENNSITIGMKNIINTLLNDNSLTSIHNEVISYYKNNSINMHYAPIIVSTDKLKKITYDSLNKKMNSTNIIKFFEKIHGPKILSMPNNSGLGYFAWFFPSIILFAFILFGILIIKRMKQ